MKQTLVALALLLIALASTVVAKDASCFTSDDGTFPCAFRSLDGQGSFAISAEGKPSFEVWIDKPGEASVSGTFEPGGRAVALPGPYHRSAKDGACWVSDATGTEICAW
jgi:hypothetical protein